MGNSAKDRVERTLQSLVLTNDEVNMLKRKLLELSDAKETVRIGRDAGGIIYGERPNLPVQLAATVKLLEFGIGKPRQAVEITNRGPGASAPRISRAELAAMLAETPSLVTAFLGGLQAAAGMKQAVAVEATCETLPAPPSEVQSGGSHSAPASP